MNTRERFYAHVEVDEHGCHIWTSLKTDGGYGRFYLNRRKWVYAHRFAYEMNVGPILDKLAIDHLCRVRLCVNAEHMEPVTNRENALRGISPWAVNARKTHCTKGHELSERRNNRGQRTCPPCRAARNRSLRSRKQVAAEPRAIIGTDIVQVVENYTPTSRTVTVDGEGV